MRDRLNNEGKVEELAPNKSAFGSFQKADSFSSITPFMKPRLLTPLFALSSSLAFSADFRKEVQPILKKHCYECHSEEADKRKAGYVFDDLLTLVLDIGPNGIVVPGDTGESHLIEVLTNDEGEKNHMPPKAQLSSGEIKKIESWIKDGAFLVNPTTVKVQGMGPAAEKWRNKEGKEIEASFIKIDGVNVHFKMPDGRVLPYPLENLSADGQIKARKALLEVAGIKPVAGK
jgi:hypothetical protein